MSAKAARPARFVVVIIENVQKVQCKKKKKVDNGQTCLCLALLRNNLKNIKNVGPHPKN